MLKLAHGWHLDVERGPDWLFVRLHPVSDADEYPAELADLLWTLLRRHITSRLVLELDDLPVLRRELIEQLVLLHERIHADGGLMRICGLSESHRTALRSCRLSDRFPSYQNREDAVMGHQPVLPR